MSLEINNGLKWAQKHGFISIVNEQKLVCSKKAMSADQRECSMKIELKKFTDGMKTDM